ncbi:MAG: hypothetical protein JW969_16845 [Spirochaetales bacterium]|nr:hypothetical protein [Spirochaetales bacterium]
MKKKLLSLVSGHVLITLSGIAYSIYWYRQEYFSDLAMSAFLLLALASGLGGVVLMGSFVVAEYPDLERRGMRLWHVCVLTSAVFTATLLVTSLMFHRLFTSELPLLMIWATVQLMVLLVCRKTGWLSGVQTVVSTVLGSLTIATGLFCYAIFYMLDRFQRFVTGLIPYGVIAVFSLVVCGFILWTFIRKKKSVAG